MKLGRIFGVRHDRWMKETGSSATTNQGLDE